MTTPTQTSAPAPGAASPVSKAAAAAAPAAAAEASLPVPGTDVAAPAPSPSRKEPSAATPEVTDRPPASKPPQAATAVTRAVLNVPQARAVEETAFGLNGGDRRFVTWAAVVALLLMAVHWWRIAAWSPAPVRVERPPGEPYRFLLDVNQATWVEWMQVEGIGETLARRIVANRAEFGRFPDVDSLRRVPGVGEKTLERIRKHALTGPPANIASDRRPGGR